MAMFTQEKLFFSFNQLIQAELPPSAEPYGERLRTLVAWVFDYLCKPHPALGRTGPVCPFVPTALEKDLLFVSIYPGVCNATPHEEVNQIILQERDLFLSMEPRIGNNAQFKSILLIFPNLEDPASHQVIDHIQARLQDEFVEKGLMVGEFHPGPPDKPGLWNEHFKPLDCPIPMLAIRHMVPTDILFLKEKSTLVAEYLRIFGDLVPSKFKHLVEEAANRFGFDMPDAHPDTSSAPTVIYLLEKNKISYKVHRHATMPLPIKRPEDFATALNYDVARISKTVFVRDQNRECYALLVCGAARQIDLALVASRMGVKRLELADAAELAEKVGHPSMAVTPIGVEHIRCFIDADLMRFETVLTGAGVARMELELSPQGLVQLSQAEVFAFVV